MRRFAAISRTAGAVGFLNTHVFADGTLARLAAARTRQGEARNPFLIGADATRRYYGLLDECLSAAIARPHGRRDLVGLFPEWVISNPAVTVALPATANPDHLMENMAAMRGPLPDAAMRRRMVAYIEAIPGFATLDAMPWYPGKSYPGVIARGQAAIRRRG